MGMKGVNFPVEEGLLAAAHKRAAHEGTTLPAAFQAWLKDYAGPANQIDPEESKRQAERSMKTIREIQQSIKVKDGRKLTREEMNERR
ncbi:MAG: hypothetical protein OXD31_08000 [Chloroflexi bacterium]|nr:hypothetical protein [Chloroflexota bacterium]